MTPQEQQLIDQLFDRLARAEGASRRDPDAVRAINSGLERAPHALYVLVQTVLLQEEALKQADQRVRELEAGQGEPEPARGGGSFLDGLRGSFGGRRDEPQQRSSVPPMRPGGNWNPMPGQQAGGMQGQPQMQQPAQGGAFGGGGSFLGTAAAAAAGMVGGSLLMNSMKGMFGGAGEQGKAQGAFDSAGSGNGGSPWESGGSGGDLGRQAGLDDVGRSGSGGGGEQHAGLYGGDQPAEDSGYLDDDYGFDDSDTA